MTLPHLRAVIFDIGGVVLRSPFVAIAEYERELGIPFNYLNCSIVARGSQGAWQRFERGELALLPFYEAFGRDLSDTTNGNVWYAEYCKKRGLKCPKLPKTLEVDGRELFGRVMRDGMVFDEHILRAIHRIRAAGTYRIIALTNNFSRVDMAVAAEDDDDTVVPASERDFLGWKEAGEGPTPSRLRALFDDFCDSSVVGLRKPDPAFYLLACERNGIRPEEAVFLDDIGVNLKTARELGMQTIHVPLGGTFGAVKELEMKLGIDLTSPEGGDSKL